MQIRSRTATTAALACLLLTSTAHASPAMKICAGKAPYAAAISSSKAVAVVEVVESKSKAVLHHGRPATQYNVILEVVRVVRVEPKTPSPKVKQRIVIDVLTLSGYPGTPRFPAKGKRALAFLNKTKGGSWYAFRPAFASPACPSPSAVTKLNKRLPGLLNKLVALDSKLAAAK